MVADLTRGSIYVQSFMRPLSVECPYCATIVDFGNVAICYRIGSNQKINLLAHEIFAPCCKQPLLSAYFFPTEKRAGQFLLQFLENINEKPLVGIPIENKQGKTQYN